MSIQLWLLRETVFCWRSENKRSVLSFISCYVNAVSRSDVVSFTTAPVFTTMSNLHRCNGFVCNNRNNKLVWYQNVSVVFWQFVCETFSDKSWWFKKKNPKKNHLIKMLLAADRFFFSNSVIREWTINHLLCTN